MNPTWLLEAALRSMLMGATIFAVLTVLRIRQVQAQRTAWVLALLAALAMPGLAHWPVAAPTMHLKQVLLRDRRTPPLAAAQKFTQVESRVDSRSLGAEVPATHMGALSRHGIRSQTATSLPAVAAPLAATRAVAAQANATKARPASRLGGRPRDFVAGVAGIFSRLLRFALPVYLVVALLLLGRLTMGLGLALRLRRKAEPALLQAVLRAQLHAGDVRISSEIQTPVTIASSIVLPASSAEWDTAKLRVVLAHERAHVRQADFLVHLLAGLHCAIFWFSPFAWWLQHKLAALGEAMSDLAALEQADSRSFYAEVLLEFATSARQPMAAVAMARSSNLRPRMERLLNDRLFREAISGTRRHPFLAAGIVPVALLASASLVRVQAAGRATAREMAQSTAQSTAKNTAQNSAHGVASAVAQGAAQPAAQSMAQSMAQSAAQSEAQTAAQPAAHAAVANAAVPASTSAAVAHPAADASSLAEPAAQAAVPMPLHLYPEPQMDFLKLTDMLPRVANLSRLKLDAEIKTAIDPKVMAAMASAQAEVLRTRPELLRPQAQILVTRAETLQLRAELLRSNPVLAAAIEKGMVGSYVDRGWGGDRNGDSYALVMDGDVNFTGRFDDHFEAIRGKVKGDFFYYEHAGKSYVIQDPVLLAKAKALYTPMQVLGKQQEALGREQEALGRQQEELGRQQETVKVPTPDLSKELATLDHAMQELKQLQASKDVSQESLAEVQGEIGEIQGRLGELQGHAGAAMGKFANQMGALGAEQGKLGAEQGHLGAQQGKLAAEAERTLKPLLEKAIQDGVAKPVD